MNDYDEEKYVEELLQKLSNAGLYDGKGNGLIEPKSDFKMYNPEVMMKVSSFVKFIKEEMCVPGFEDEIKFEISPAFDAGILTYTSDAVEIPSLLMGKFGLHALDATSISIESTLDSKVRISFLYDNFILRN